MLKVKIISGTVDPLYDISNAARMCTNTQDKNDIRTRESFVRARIRNGEENLLEHAYVQLEISGISRSCLQQLVRHRYHVVYSVQSQRYVDQSNAEFVVPLSLRGTTMESQFLAFCGVALDNYKKLLERGVKKEDARYLLPEATCTKAIITYNFRGLRHLIRMRACPKAQWEIRNLAKEILRVVADKYGTDFFAEGLEVSNKANTKGLL